MDVSGQQLSNIWNFTLCNKVITLLIHFTIKGQMKDSFKYLKQLKVVLLSALSGNEEL